MVPQMIQSVDFDNIMKKSVVVQDTPTGVVVDGRFMLY
jgi:hypothetical protein